jgi:hypothetical protein
MKEIEIDTGLTEDPGQGNGHLEKDLLHQRKKEEHRLRVLMTIEDEILNQEVLTHEDHEENQEVLVQVVLDLLRQVLPHPVLRQAHQDQEAEVEIEKKINERVLLPETEEDDIRATLAMLK